MNKEIITEKDLIKYILVFDVNIIHTAQENLGFSTNWEILADELKTYNFNDLKVLFEELLFNSEV